MATKQRPPSFKPALQNTAVVANVILRMTNE